MGITRAQLKLLRRRDNRRKWYRRLFLPVFVLGPVLAVAFLTLVDSQASFEGDLFIHRANTIAREYGARITAMVPGKTINLAIPDKLTNETDMGCYQAVQLFYKLCLLGGPDMVLKVFRINPERIPIGGSRGDLDEGERFTEVHKGIPSAKNPMTLDWAEILINGNTFE